MGHGLRPYRPACLSELRLQLRDLGQGEKEGTDGWPATVLGRTVERSESIYIGMLGFAGWKILADHFWVLCCMLLEERQRLGSHCLRSCAGRDPCSSQEEHRQGSDGCG